MAIYIVLTVIFFVFGIIFAFNKGDFLIAGLNSSESNQNEYDTKKSTICVLYFRLLLQSFRLSEFLSTKIFIWLEFCFRWLLLALFFWLYSPTQFARISEFV